MSYKDDEELKIGEFAEEEDADLDLDVVLPLDDDTLIDDTDEPEGIADLDGAEF